MKSRKFLASLIVLIMIVTFSGVTAFADEAVPAAEEPAAVEPTTEEPVSEEPAVEEPVSEPETSYVRLTVDGEDLVFVVEDGVIVSASNELDMNSEEPAAEEPAAEEPAAEEPAAEEPAAEEPAAEEPAAEEPAAEEPAAEEPAAEEPADPYEAYVGLTLTEGVDLVLASGETDESIRVDIFANGETADELQALLEEGYAETLEVKAIALDSDNPNADRFLYAAIYKITPGKMNLLEKLGATFDESEIDYATWSTLSVKEIQSMTKANQVQKVNASNGKEKSSNAKAKGKKK